MSSCFLCDCSYRFKYGSDFYNVKVPDSIGTSVKKLMKQLPIVIGSSGLELDDQQHDNSKKQNYFPYSVKKIEFRCVFSSSSTLSYNNDVPDYILIFKVPFREPIFDYNFYLLESFMLYSEPECVLGYSIRPRDGESQTGDIRKQLRTIKIDINKPFIVGPNEYVGVFYMAAETYGHTPLSVDASARVWFNTA